MLFFIFHLFISLTIGMCDFCSLCLSFHFVSLKLLWLFCSVIYHLVLLYLSLSFIACIMTSIFSSQLTLARLVILLGGPEGLLLEQE